MSSTLVPMENAPLPPRGPDVHDIDAVGVPEADSELASDMIARSFDKLLGMVSKLADHNLAQMIATELAYLRQLSDGQNNKIDKLSAVVSEVLESKNQQAILSSLHALQGDSDAHGASLTDLAAPTGEPIPNEPHVHIDGNMDPELHQVAVAAAAVRAQGHVPAPSSMPSHATQPHNPAVPPQQPLHAHAYAVLDNDRKRLFTGEEGSNGSKKPKINIDFLHNPMTVREIYDEFTVGFRGQPALCELDARFGKHEWRGDLRSKQSKRFQRRKKLCDAISRGMQKYNKSADEIIDYIEEFRGDKLLTWVMNGNLPADLL